MAPSHRMLPILIVKMGTTLPDIAERRGDFDLWIRARAGLRDDEVRVVSAQSDELPSCDSFRAAILTGSSAMVTDREGWSVRAAAWIREAVAREKPLFGICYGHQLIADAFGGKVEKNPRGREIGTVRIELTAEAANDRVFAGVSQQGAITVQATHLETVSRLPDGAIRLGFNELDANQAFSFGERTWGVQFHPDFDADVIRAYLHARRDRIESEGTDVDQLLARTRDSEHGERLLSAFAGFVRSQ